MFKRTSRAEPEAGGAACAVMLTPEQVENRGLAWVIGAFLICPCHLPITLWLATSVLAGTAAGAVLREHPFTAGTVITVAWVAATWHGVRLLRSARTFARGVGARRPDGPTSTGT